MYRQLVNLIKGTFFIGCLFTVLAEANGQGCCPAPGACNPCNGGVSVLKLRYHGFLPAYVNIIDGSPQPVFSGLVAPGSTFTVLGTTNGRFDGNYVYIQLNLFFHTQIRVTCALDFDPSTYYGLFSIVSAESRNGGIMCCTSNNGSVTPPDIFGCPGNIARTATTGCNAVATWTEPTAPECDVVSFSSTHAPGATFPVGTTVVTYTARNANNLTNTCSFNVVVTDATAPGVTTPTANVTVDAGTNCRASATWTAPQFADNCAVTSVTSTHNPGSSFSLGNTQVTYTARDAAGNSVTSRFTVTVRDATPPALTACPADVTVEATAGCSAAATWVPPVFTDACSPVTVVASHNPGTVFNTGITAVTYTAKDNANNTTTCRFNVIVRDKNAPVFVSCPSDTTISTTAIGGVAYSWPAPEVTDDCTTPTVESSHAPGQFFPVGRTNVSYTATDVSGNTTTCSFMVEVKQESTILDIVQLITPDGNDVNDAWIIGNIELYKDNKVVIVDRWGSVIYHETGYDNERKVWTGRNAEGNTVPSGTYFYTISIRSGTQLSERKGFIEVVR